MKCERLYDFGGRCWLVFGQDPDRAARVAERNLAVVSQGDASILINPGGALSFPAFWAALEQEHRTDGIRDIILTRDDPAAASSMALWREALGGDVRFHVPWLAAGDVGHFDASADVIPVPDAGGLIPLGNFQPLELVPAHYLPSPGNFSVFDKEAAVLYSGAIGCADLAPEDRDGLYVKKLMAHVDRLAAHHQRVMSSDEARTSWVNRVQLLEPSHLVPEKGPVLRGIQVREFLEWFGGLRLGSATEGVFDLDDDVPEQEEPSIPVAVSTEVAEAAPAHDWGDFGGGADDHDMDISAFADTDTDTAIGADENVLSEPATLEPDPDPIPAPAPVLGGSLEGPTLPTAAEGMPDPLGEPLALDDPEPLQLTDPVPADDAGFNPATAPVPVFEDASMPEPPSETEADPIAASPSAVDPVWPPEPVLPPADEDGVDDDGIAPAWPPEAVLPTDAGAEAPAPIAPEPTTEAAPEEDEFDPRLLVPDSIFGEGLSVLENMRELGLRFRLVTRSDFDGLVCAVLLEELDLIDDILFVHPSEVQHGMVELSDTDLSTNLPYDGRVFLCFDHHLSEVSRVGNLNKNHIIDAKAPSAARVVYNYFGGHETFPMISVEMMDAVDKADAAQFSEEEVLDPRGWELLNFIMDPRTGLGRFRGFRIPNYELMMELIEQIRLKPIHQILELPDVKERVDLYMEHRHEFEEQLDRCARMHGKLVVIDLREEETIFTGNRFLIYALFPESNISMHVMHGKQQENTAFAVGKSIFDRSSEVIVGDLMLEYGGGGHKAAGTCLVQNERAEEVKLELIKRISEAT